jgi:integrase
MPVVKLVARNVTSLPAIDNQRTDYRDEDLTGFVLRVSPTGQRTYSVTYFKAGKLKRLTIGAVERISLADARDHAKQLLANITKGADPAAERQLQREAKKLEAEAPRFTDLCDLFVKEQSADWRPSTRKGWTRYIDREIKPALGGLNPQALTADDVRAMIDAIRLGIPDGSATAAHKKWKRRPAPVSARRCFEVVRRLCTWAVWKKYLPVSPCEQARPFERKKSGKRKAARAKPYTDDQIRAIFTASQGTELEVLIDLVARTGVRSHEGRAARLDDFDIPRKLWRVPPEMHKVGDQTGVPHLVPLTKGALRVLKAVRDAQSDGDSVTWLFPAATKNCEVCGQDGHMDKPNKAYTAIKERAGITDRGLLHRFRDTIKTRMSEHGVSERVSEHILGHVVPGIAGTYDHAEMLTQRREALAWWDQELDRILRVNKKAAAQPATTNVVEVARARRNRSA